MVREACVFALLGFSIAGCATTSAVQLGASTRRPPVPWEQVAVYREASQVTGPYEEIALLHGTGEWGWSGEGTVYNSMKKKAGALGANAIILDSMSEPGTGAKVVSMLFGAGAERKGKALAIYISRQDTTSTGSKQ